MSRPGLLLLGALLLGITPATVQGQTILNTERFQLHEVDGFHMSADFSADGSQGNSRFLNTGASGIVGFRDESNWTRVIFGGKFLSDAERSILDNQYAQVRYSRLLSPRTRTFHFLQAQRNETLRLKRRYLAGTGIRYRVAGGDRGRTRLDAGTGLMLEWERLDPDAFDDPAVEFSVRTPRMSNLAVLSHELEGGARLVNILYVQPDVGDLQDIRVLNDLGLLVPITSSARVTISAEWRYDSQPPGDLRRNDLSWSAGFGIDVR
ncbi:MAG: DUF481 domain-containing protein [Gemmatimonadales bacterium]|nr:MAG: DUF481 domain-containing protein [Gemmatimonadales bacterium]